MTRYRYHTAMSLDGFLADEADSLEWLFRQNIDENGAGSVTELLADVGVQVMGSSTYTWVLEHEPGWQPDRPTFVFTHRDLRAANEHVRFLAGSPVRHRVALEAATGGRDVWVMGGGGLAAEFAASGLLDEVAVSIAPVMLGSGKPLFTGELNLELQECARNGDFVMARYDVVGQPGDRIDVVV